ncbi:MAG: hypothetical protein M1826_004664 [Phylliscum demangeonii]|nr:MAG: hypothetical protein M1826_004664 [Phylliscum demangeonii]
MKHLERSQCCYGCTKTFTTLHGIILHLETDTCPSGLNLLHVNHAAAECYQWRQFVDDFYRDDMLAYRPLKRTYDEDNQQVLPYRCPTCATGFRQLSGLVQHVFSRACGQTMDGGILTLSAAMVPALLRAPAPILVRQWQAIYDRGKTMAPPLALAAGCNFGYLAYYHYVDHYTTFALSSRTTVTVQAATYRWAWYLLAATAATAVVPYTLVVMTAVNGRLQDMAKVATLSSSDDEKEMYIGAKGLVDEWASLNFFRGLLPVSAAVVAAWAMFS